MIVWLTVSIRYINFIIIDNIGLTTFLRIILCALPDILTMVIPICFLISGIFIFYKMKTDQELIAIMTSGKSILAIAQPLLIFAFLQSCIMLYTQTVLTPYAYTKMASIQNHIKNKVSMSVIKPGIFNVLGSSTVYIGSKTDSSLNNIFISYIPNNRAHKTNIITAKSGHYDITGNRMFIKLVNGFRQVLDKENNVIANMKFSEFSYDITDFVKRYSSYTARPHEKTQKELFESAQTASDPQIYLQHIAEAYGRYIISSAPIISALFIAILLITADSRTKRIAGLLKSSMAGIISQISIIHFVNLSRKINGFIFYEYIIISFLIIVLSFIAFFPKKI